MMKKTVLLLVAASLWGNFLSNAWCATSRKIGVLVIGSGMNETYRPDWIVGYTSHFYPSFTQGMLAGGPLEGETCYSLIHYANEAESAICSQVRGTAVPQGTPIDIFCNEYTNAANYPVHAMFAEPLFGKHGFLNTCYGGILPYFIFTGHTTTDPGTGTVIVGPHVNDPNGSGIGIADFLEMYAFYYMTYHYDFGPPDYRDPYRRQFLRYVFGNDTPPLYGYSPDAVELSNIRSEVAKALDNETTVVYRMGWEAYMRNHDMYGKDTAIADSTETALHELIEDEKVDRIIVFGTGAHYSNVTNWGYCWRDSEGRGVSSVDNATYYECVNDLSDGCGPDDSKSLVKLVSKKPWRTFEATYPLIHDLAKAIKPELPVTFANAFGDDPGFNQAVVEMLKYTVSKYDIDNASSLKVVLATHGYGNGFMNGAQCDSYFNKASALTSRVKASVEDYLAHSWAGKHEVAGGSNEFSEPSSEDPMSDKPDKAHPMGSVMSTGEQIDVAINGKYVNELGQVVDNGNNKFDYVIVIPILWEAENVDTITDFRHLTLGNHSLQSANGSKAWLRQKYAQDGSPYHIATDYDSEFFTAKKMDASGWESTPARTKLLRRPVPVKKGSAQKPTTVILAGTVLSQGNGAVRSRVVQAAAESILEAIHDPAVGGYLDEACEMKALSAVDE
jgi:hypothetical protein